MPWTVWIRASEKTAEYPNHPHRRRDHHRRDHHHRRRRRRRSEGDTGDSISLLRSPLGVKRTWPIAVQMSAYGTKRTRD